LGRLLVVVFSPCQFLIRVSCYYAVYAKGFDRRGQPEWCDGFEVGYGKEHGPAFPG